MIIDETIKVIDKYVNKTNCETVVDFSGGRYSLVLLHIVSRILKDFKVVYIDTTISLPECNSFVEDICDKMGLDLIVIRRTDTDFWELVKRRGFPHRRFRWCMREFKSIPLKLFNESYDGEILHIVGTSMYESSFRRKVYSIRGPYHYNYSISSYVLHPLLKWTEEMIYEYMKKHGLQLNPCYEKYYSSGNCYYCPFISSLTYYIRLATLQPKLFYKIVEAEKSMRKGGGAIYVGKGKVLHLSSLTSYIERRPKSFSLSACEQRAYSKSLFKCQKKCLM